MDYNELEEALCPDVWELQKNEEGTYFVNILDQEMDEVTVEFHYDDGVFIKCEGYTHLCLHQYDLERLAELVEETNDLYKNNKDE